jgi:hypothetical protein
MRSAAFCRVGFNPPSYEEWWVETHPTGEPMRTVSRIAVIATLIAAGCSPKSRPSGPIFNDSSNRSFSQIPAQPTETHNTQAAADSQNAAVQLLQE